MGLSLALANDGPCCAPRESRVVDTPVKEVHISVTGSAGMICRSWFQGMLMYTTPYYVHTLYK
jgi:hypothetical protein